MGSAAAATFAERTKDIERLMEIHAGISRRGVGRRVGVEVLNRSAIVLVTAMWEGYVEDLATEGVKHLVDHVAGPDHLPAELRKTVSTEIKKDPHDFAAWKLAGPAWKIFLRTRLADYAELQARQLNTPKSEQVDALFKKALELPKISDSWVWTKMTADRARTKLDDMVGLRGDIAHGSGTARGVQKPTVTAYMNHAQRLVAASDATVNAHLAAIGTPLF